MNTSIRQNTSPEAARRHYTQALMIYEAWLAAFIWSQACSLNARYLSMQALQKDIDPDGAIWNNYAPTQMRVQTPSQRSNIDGMRRIAARSIFGQDADALVDASTPGLKPNLPAEPLTAEQATAVDDTMPREIWNVE